MRAQVAVAWLLLLVPLAGAQPAAQSDACRAPDLTFQQAPATVPPGEAFNLLFAIENTNGPPVDAVRATVTTTAPAGWTATVAQRDLTLGPHNVTLDVLALTAPDRGTGDARGNVTITVTFVCTSGGFQTGASATHVVPVEIRSFQAPWTLVIGAFLLLAAGVGVLGLRRLRRGVAIHAAQPERSVEPGKSAKFTYVVENRRGKPQQFRLEHSALPEGWSLHLALAHVSLEPGEEKAMWAIVKAPPQASVGQSVAILLRLVEPRGAREAASALLTARVESAPERVQV